MMTIRLLLIILFIPFNVNSGTSIVASIKPIHSITSSIASNISSPKLLLDSSQDAHHFHLKPSQIRMINDSNLLIAINPNFETGMSKLLNGINGNNKIIITDTKKINLIHSNDNSSTNYHLWLDISNMKIIANHIAEKLILIDPYNKNNYKSNLNILTLKLDKLEKKITNKLSKYRNNKLSTYSNSLQYFIESNMLKKPSIVTNYHGGRLSIKAAIKARNTIINREINCLLSDIDISKEKIDTITNGLNIKKARIDVMGVNINEGSEQYFMLMNNITDEVVKCLQ